MKKKALGCLTVLLAACLSLSGCAAGETLPAEVPETTIVQEAFAEEGTESLRVLFFRPGDGENIRNNKGLRELEIVHCQDFSGLSDLMKENPELKVRYQVDLGGDVFRVEDPVLRLKDESCDRVSQALDLLPNVKKVIFTGELPAQENLSQLGRDYPDLELSWELCLGDQTLTENTKELKVPAGAMNSPEEAEKLLSYLPKLSSLDLTEAGLTEKQRMALRDAHEEMEIFWEIPMGEERFLTSDREITVSGLNFTEIGPLKDLLSSFPKLQKAVILDSGLSNEQLDQLNQELKDVRIVWNLKIGNLMMRTDDTYFAPNKYKHAILTDENLEPLKYCPDILCVDIGHSGITRCEWLYGMPNLKYLIMADSGVVDLTPVGSLQKLVFLEIFQTPVKDYSPLVNCKSLEDLNLSYSYGAPEPVKQMTWLDRLWWNGIRIPEEDMKRALPDTQVECNTGSSTGGDWRKGKNYFDMRDTIEMYYMVG